jgi:hypothetical protein
VMAFFSPNESVFRMATASTAIPSKFAFMPDDGKSIQ